MSRNEQSGTSPGILPEPRILPTGGVGSLTSLDLGNCPSLVSNAGLQALRGLPLTSLSLDLTEQRSSATVAGLAVLADMPLTSLSLQGFGEIPSLAALGELPLTHLGLRNCRTLSLKTLEDLPLTSLDLGDAAVYGQDLPHIRRLPLTSLDLGGSQPRPLINWNLEVLQEMPLTHLSLRRCERLTDSVLQHLLGSPLASLDLWRCAGISDAGLDLLRGLPLSQLNFPSSSRGPGSLSPQAWRELSALQKAWNRRH